jgi:hypothetical protein
MSWAQVRANVFHNVRKVCLVIFSIQNFHDLLSSVASAYWLVGSAVVLLECPGNARLELQIVDVPHGQEDFIDGDGHFFENQDPAPI